jgi:4'-phosphopantetheinyl transferase
MSHVDFAALRAVLSPEELGRAATAHNHEEARRYVSAHGAARFILARYLGTAPRDIAWTLGPQGKPAVEGVEFSLSHSGELSLIAVSARRPVGVDIQEAVAGLDAAGLARRFFQPQEADDVDAATDPGLVFARLWARKEAIVKARGDRLTAGLGIPVRGGRSEVAGRLGWGWFRVTDVPAPAGFQAAVALEGAEPYAVELLEWSPTLNVER